jgi:hypothetical protein
MVIAQSVITNGFFWAFPCIFVISAIVTSRLRRNQRPNAESSFNEETGPDLITPLLFPAMASAAWCIFAAFRDGAAKNTILEGYICLATYAVVLLLRNRNYIALGLSRRWAGLVYLSILSMAVFPVTQLTFPDKVGNLTVASAEEYEQKKSLATFLDRLPKPAYVEDGMLAQPWHSNNCKYPAIVLDIVFYYKARAHGWMENGGIEELVAKHAFRSLLIKGRPLSREAALQSGYQPVPFPSDIDAIGFELLELKSTSLSE